MKNKTAALERAWQRILVKNRRADKFDPIARLRKIRLVAAAHVVKDAHPRAQRHQRIGQMRSDKPRAAGNDYRP